MYTYVPVMSESLYWKRELFDCDLNSVHTNVLY